MSHYDIDKDLSPPKVFLMIVSIIMGLIFGVIYENIIIGLVVSLGYPVTGAFVIMLCSIYRKKATFGNSEPWKKELKIGLGAIWPLTLIWSLIVYTYLLLINMVFKQE